MRRPLLSLFSGSGRRGPTRRRSAPEVGDTLVELLIAVVILGIAAVAILLAFTTTIMGSSSYQSVASMDTVLKSAANEATSAIQHYANPPTAPVQSATYTSPSGGVQSFTVGLNNAIAAGDALVLVVDLENSSHSVTVSGNGISGGGVTWAQATGTGGSTSDGDSEIWYGLDSTGGSGTITVTLSASGTAVEASLSEWAGIAGYDLSATCQSHAAVAGCGTTGTGTSVSAGTITPSWYGELFISGVNVVTGASETPSGGYTALADASTGASWGYGAYDVEATSDATTSTTWTEGASTAWASTIAAFTPSVTAFTCPAQAYEPTFSLPAGYSVTSYSLQYWTGSATTTTCSSGDPVFVTLTVTAPNGRRSSISFIVDNPRASSAQSATTPSKLLFIALPVDANVGSSFSPPIAVAVVGSNGNVVSGDISQMSLAIASGPTGGSLSSSCNPSGVEYYGIFTFSNCSVNMAGTYTVSATDQYGKLAGNDAPYNPATSSPFTVGDVPTVTVTNNSGVSVGGTLIFTATVAGPSGAPTPTAQINWTIAAPSGALVPCSSAAGPTASSSSGSSTMNVATYTCTIGDALQGVYGATASYPGDTNYEPSTGFDSSAVVTGPPQPTSITLAESSSSLTYGDEGAETFSGTVTGVSDEGYPEGTVTVSAGGDTICSETLPVGTGDSTNYSCLPTGSVLAASSSSYSITATYTPGSTSSSELGFMYEGSTSSPQSVTVNQDSTTTAVSESPTTVIYGGESAAVFTVTVTTGNGEVLPETDDVTVNVGSANCVASVAPSGNGGTGTCSIGNTALAISSTPYTVTATYLGDTDLTASATATAPTGLTVTQTTTTTAVSLSSPTVAYGNESTVTFTVTVTTGDVTSLPTGTTASVSVDSGAATCTVNLSPTPGGGSGTCSIANTALGAGGPYGVTATFPTTDGYQGSSGSMGIPTPTTLYATGDISNSSFHYTTAIATCPSGDVALSGGGYDAGSHQGQLAPLPAGDTDALASSATTGATSLSLSSGLPFAVASGDTIVVESSTSSSVTIDTFLANAAASAGATSVVVHDGDATSGSGTVPAGSYVVDVTSSAWAPPQSGNGSFATTSIGWYTSNSETSTADAETTYVTCAGASSVTTVTEYATSGSGTTESADATCPTGDVVLGGGGYDSATSPHQSQLAPYAGSTPPLAGSGSYSTAPTGWYAAHNDTTGTETAYVVCGTAPSSTVTEYATSASGTESVDVTCPTGDIAVGGGAGDDSADSHLTQLAPYAGSTPPPTPDDGVYTPAPTGWYGANSDTGTTETAYALCAATGLTVTQDTTTTTVSESPTSVSYGSENSSTFTVTITTGNHEELPTGETATVNVGSTSCTVNLTPGGNGASGTCTIGATSLTPSSTAYSVSATYSGDTNLSGSNGTAATGLTVNPESESTTTSLTAPSTLTYGAESATAFTGTVTGQAGDGYPEGTVTVKTSGGTTICTATLTESTTDSSTYSCTATSATLLSASSTAYSVTATYTPAATSSSNADYTYTGSTSSASSVTVNKDTTTTTVSESPTSVANGSESSVTFTATVTAHNGEAVPSGDTITVSVNSGAATCTITLPATTCTIGNNALPVGGPYAVSATFNGDTNLSTSTGSAATGLTVTKATPTLTVTGPATGTAGTAIAATSISGTLGSTSGSNATGTITFTVFGPESSAPTTCTSGGTTVGTAGVTGNGTYNPSAGYTPTQVGDYWWYASYGGDTNNNTATSTCGSAMSETVVGKAAPTLTASGPSTGTVGTAIAATSISGTLGSTSGSNATGTITFTVFGPASSAPTTCTSGGTTVGTANVTNNGTYDPSAGYTPTQAGDYWWYASYGGDANNSTATSTCGSGMSETVVGISTTTVYETGSTDNGIAEANCPAGDVAIGGGGYNGGGGETDLSGPVTAAVLSSSSVTSSSTTLALGTGGLPFAVANGDTLLVGAPGAQDSFAVNHTGGYAAGTTSITVDAGSGSTTETAGAYVYDITAAAWEPATSGSGTAATSYGWYYSDTSNHDETVTAYAVCTSSSAVTTTTVYETGSTDNGITEANCPAGDVAIGGGGYNGGGGDIDLDGPVTAAVLGTGISGSGNTSLTLTSSGLPYAVANGDTLLVGTPGTQDTFTVNHTGGYTAGTTSIAVHDQTGTATIAAGAYVFDLTAAAWEPATSGSGTAATSYGWYYSDTSNTDETVTAYAVCTSSSTLATTTVYETGSTDNGIAEATCPAGDVAIGGGGYNGGGGEIDLDGPVTAAVLSSSSVTSSSTTLALGTGGLPFAVANGDTLLVGAPGAQDTFTVNHAGGYAAGTTSITVDDGSGSTTETAGAYVFDVSTSTDGDEWRPATSGSGTAATSYGWYYSDTSNFFETVTAYAVCAAE